MHVYVRWTNFTNKPRFEIAKELRRCCSPIGQNNKAFFCPIRSHHSFDRLDMVLWVSIPRVLPLVLRNVCRAFPPDPGDWLSLGLRGWLMLCVQYHEHTNISWQAKSVAQLYSYPSSRKAPLSWKSSRTKFWGRCGRKWLWTVWQTDDKLRNDDLCFRWISKKITNKRNNPRFLKQETNYFGHAHPCNRTNQTKLGAKLCNAHHIGGNACPQVMIGFSFSSSKQTKLG